MAVIRPTTCSPAILSTLDGGPEGFWVRHRGRLHLVAYLASLLLAQPLWPQVLTGLPLIAAGLALRTYALGHLTKDQRLCTSGPYAYCRHPLYLGSLLILVGFCLAANHPWLTLAAIPLATLSWALTIRAEERFLATRFGPRYAWYRRAVPRLLPWRGRQVMPDPHAVFAWDRANRNATWPMAGWVLLLLVLLIAKALLGPALGWWPYAEGEPALTYGLWWPGR